MASIAYRPKNLSFSNGAICGFPFNFQLQRFDSQPRPSTSPPSRASPRLFTPVYRPSSSPLPFPPFPSSLDDKQRQQPSARTFSRSSSSGALSMSGFGGGKAKKPKETPPKLTSGESVARTALKEYNQIKRDGGTVAKVHARLKGTEEWFPVGSVSIIGNTLWLCNSLRCSSGTKCIIPSLTQQSRVAVRKFGLHLYIPDFVLFFFTS